MSDTDFRQLRGQITQLAQHLNLEWKRCPRNWSSFTEEERDKHPHAYGYCKDGLVTNGYADPPVCGDCHGAGEILAPKKED